MTDQTYIHAGFAGLATGTSLRARVALSAWIGGRGRMEANPKSLAERWKG